MHGRTTWRTWGGERPGQLTADWFLAPSGYAGEVPDAATMIEIPSDIAVIVGPVQVDGEADLPAVHALQDQFTLTASEPSGAMGIPVGDEEVSGEAVGFWERFRVYLRRFPPPAADRHLHRPLPSACSMDEESPFVDPDPALAPVLAEGTAKAKSLLESLVSGGGGEPGAWTSVLHMFDYNLDRCGPGTIDSPDWKIPDRKKAYVTRAVAARAGLWGNHGYEADYEIVHQDEHGDPLNGGHRYEVTFNPPPPAGSVLVAHHVRHPRLLPRRQPDQPLLDRRPHSRPRTTPTTDQSRSTSKSTNPTATRPANWLPAPSGDLPTNPPHVRTRPQHPRRHLRSPEDPTRRLAPRPTPNAQGESGGGLSVFQRLVRGGCVRPRDCSSVNASSPTSVCCPGHPLRSGIRPQPQIGEDERAAVAQEHSAARLGELEGDVDQLEGPGRGRPVVPADRVHPGPFRRRDRLPEWRTHPPGDVVGQIERRLGPGPLTEERVELADPQRDRLVPVDPVADDCRRVRSEDVEERGGVVRRSGQVDEVGERGPPGERRAVGGPCRRARAACRSRRPWRHRFGPARCSIRARNDGRPGTSGNTS